jgi:benzodiazapine receptor
MRLVIFFLLNFGALALGGFLSGNPGENEWYQGLNKAPFTPPGWVFGFAWTTIMICFSFYLFNIVKSKKISYQKEIISLFILQWILNVSWNPIFFKYHYVVLAQIILIALTLVILYFLIYSINKKEKLNVFLILPYFLWLIIANGLNGYIWLYN